MRYVLLFIAVCALVVGAIFLMGPAEADTIIVDDDWPGADYSTISAAIAAADPGDTIRVYDGTYNEANDINKPLDLVGNGTSTVIYGKGFDHVFGFNLMGGDTNVSGFKFYAWWPTHHYGGVGIYSNGNSVCNNTFYSNNRGIFLGGCRDNVILNNTFDKGYYDILVYDGAHETQISFNTFSRVYAYSILMSYSNDVEIFSNTFYNNTRGMVALHSADNAVISYNMFDGSLVPEGTTHGIKLYNAVDGHIHNNTIIGVNMSLTIVGTTDLRVEDNTIIGGEVGIRFGRLFSGRYQLGLWCNGTIVRNNNIVGQGTYGMDTAHGQVTDIDARQNWWGDASGPYHPVNNTNGGGSNATDLVVYSSWLTSMNDALPPIAYIFEVTPALAIEGERVTFIGRGLARNTTVEYLWSSSIDGDIHRGTDMAFSLSDLSPGIHTISLRVKDSYGKWSSPVTTELVVNGRPVASIVSISPPVVNDGEEVSFLGRGTDHENDIRYVVWESDIDGVLSNRLEFTTTSLSNGTHIISLHVVDGYDVWSEAAIGEVIVNGRPRAIIDSVEHPLVNEGEAVILRGTYIDHEDGIITFWWGSDIDGELSDQMLFHTSSLSNGTHTITYRVRDDFLVWSENATVTVTVNGLPRVSIVSIGPELPTTGEVVQFEGAWTDHESTILAFEWTSDIDGLLSTLEDFETTRLSPGVHTITFRAMDGQRVWSERAWTSLTVNGPPTAWIEPSDVSLVDRGDTYHLVGGFSDPEGDIRGYEWTSDVDGVIGTAWNLTTSSLSNGSHIISFRVIDGRGAWSRWARVEVTVNGLPEAVIVGITPSSALEGETIEFIGSYVDHEGDAFEAEWRSDRDGFLSHEMGFVTTDLSNGSHVITLRVMDGYGVWSEPVTGKVHVNGRPRAWIETVDPLRVNQGERVHFAGAGEDDLSVVAYHWSSSIDGALSDISVFSTRDLSPGTHEISFSVQDDRGVWSEPAFTIVEVDTQIVGASVTWTEVPFRAFEGTEVVIVCVIENDGDLPLLGLVVSVEMGEHLVGVHTLGEALGPGERTTLEFTWVAELGIHIAFVSLVHDGVLLDSTFSDDLMMVEPLPDPYQNEDPDGPGPDDGPGVVDGANELGMTFLLMAIATLLAVTAMVYIRLRRPD